MRGQVVNAEKGDLLLCPGGPGGMIGALLSALVPRQHYTHMGIFIDDGSHVRHATMVRNYENEAFWIGVVMEGSALESKAPTRGLDPDAVRYGWPGTITQRTEDAWASQSHDDRIGYLLIELHHPDAATLEAAKNNKSDQLKIKDPISGECCWVNALSFDPVIEPETGLTYPALLVKPCPALLGQFPWVGERVA
jgi:hypothetical protein